MQVDRFQFSDWPPRPQVVIPAVAVKPDVDLVYCAQLAVMIPTRVGTHDCAFDVTHASVLAIDNAHLSAVAVVLVAAPMNVFDPDTITYAELLRHRPPSDQES